MIHSRRGEVVEGGRVDRGHGAVELVEGLDHGERRSLEPGAGVGGVPGGDLGLHQGAQQLLGCPPLGLRGAQQLRRQLTHGGQLEPAQPVGEVRRQRWRSGAHDDLPITVRAAVVAAEGVVRQRAGRDAGQLEHEGLPGRGGLWCPGAGGEDGAHVGCPPAAERDRPGQGVEEGPLAVRGGQGVQLGQFRPSRVLPAAAAPVRNASAVGPSAQNAFSATVFGRTARRGAGRGPP